ncbi:uncharacterized protein LOC119569324 [Penaeus monodon]|uniref:uncharacterized protein LOC119569324 n=1 Tax=Penaeus monodon TaxID=6687 RepID=UPI0018A777A9|nr:uncharacterized protein LOC119569324 [Penaeus monodon]
MLAIAVKSEEVGRFISRRASQRDLVFAPIALPSAHARNIRLRRDSGYAAPAHAPAPGYSKPRGKVGPVYTFVKTDYNGNFKWGVRHRAGAQYGGHGH